MRWDGPSVYAEATATQLFVPYARAKTIFTPAEKSANYFNASAHRTDGDGWMEQYSTSHSTQNRSFRGLSSPEDRATAIGNRHNFSEDRTCSSEDMIMDRQTDRHAHHNTPIPYGSGGGVKLCKIKTSGNGLGYLYTTSRAFRVE